jgi:hypothetical protein
MSALRGSVPAFLLLAMCAGTRGMSLPQALTPALEQQPGVQEISSGGLSSGVISPSQTLLVSAHQSSGTALLRARLQPSVDVVGRAPLSGQISRVMVNAGEFVQVNDRILQISSGADARPPAPAERAQARAEQEQVEAAEAQEALQRKLQRAQTRLVAAQSRVERARSRVEEAQSIIGKLQRGEITLAPPSEEPSTQEEAPRESRAAETTPAPQPPSRDAVAEAQSAMQKAQGEADRAAQKAAAAQRALTEAEQEVTAKTQAVLEARTTVEAAQKRLAEGTAKDSDVTAAKSVLNEAESAAATARSNVQSARTAASSADKASVAARAAARESGEKVRALRALQNMPLFTDKPQNDKPATSASRRSTTRRRSARRPNPAGISSIEEAAQMVESATSESRSAVAAARRIRNEVEDYERQVRSTQERLSSTGEGLEAAQQRVLDSTIQANLSVVRAPSSGTVLWVAPVADEVASGEAIITIGRNEVLEARLVDHSGAWKNLKRDDVLSGVVQTEQQTEGKNASGGAQTRAADAEATQVQDSRVQAGAVPVTARVREVIEPTKPGQPAVLRVAVFNPRRRIVAEGRAPRRFRPGMALLCSVDKPGSRRSISIPSAAVLREGKDQGVIAVLAPVAEDATAEGAHRIEWRPVTLGSSDGVEQEITGGLRSGERIALQPLALRAFFRQQRRRRDRTFRLN